MATEEPDTTEVQEEGPPDDRPMTLGEHLEELRSRLVRALLWALAGVAVAMVFQDRLMGIALAPVAEVLRRHGLGAIQQDTIPAGFFSALKVSLVAGLFLSGPMVLREVWQFVSSGLYPKERRWVLLFAPTSYLLFVAGALFWYFVMQPFALEVLLTYLGDIPDPKGGTLVLEVRPRIMETVGFFLSMSLVMGVIFELPLVMIFAQLVGVVDWRTYKAYRRHFIMGSMIVAAVVTPTGDALNLLATMVPITLLFEGGIIVCRLMDRKRED